MPPAESTIDIITYIISVYIGYILLSTGFIGNFINILVFTQLKLFRKNPSAFYLTIASIIECMQLAIITLPRVITAASGYDPTRTSNIWCRLRAYLSQYGSTVLTTTICCIAIDQYLSTSYHNQLRQISTYKLAQHVTLIFLLMILFYCIPAPIFNEIRSSTGCTVIHPVYNYYYSFVHLCLIVGFIPIVISTLFSFFAYHNVRRITRRQIPIVRRRLDRQLTAMVLIRVALFVITASPFVSYRMYQRYNSNNETMNSYSIAIDQLIKTILTAIYNVNYTGTFYIFLITSARYRRQVKYLFIKKIWRKFLLARFHKNQISPGREILPTRSRILSTETDD